MTTVIVPSGHGALIFSLPPWWPMMLVAISVTMSAAGRNLGIVWLRYAGEVLVILGAAVVVTLDVLARNWALVGTDLAVIALSTAILVTLIRRQPTRPPVD